MHAAVGGGVPCLVMVPSVPSVSVCCWFRHLVFPALRVPADIVGVWSMAALVLVFCAWQRISPGGWVLSAMGSTRGGWLSAVQDYIQFLAIARNTAILLQFSVSGSGWVWLGALALKSIFCGNVKK